MSRITYTGRDQWTPRYMPQDDAPIAAQFRGRWGLATWAVSAVVVMILAFALVMW